MGPPARGAVRDDFSFETQARPGKARVNVAPLPAGISVKAVRYNGVDVTDFVETPRQGASENKELDLATVPFHLSFQRLIDLFRASNGNALGSIMSRLQAYAAREIPSEPRARNC